jgi:YfiH family protein
LEEKNRCAVGFRENNSRASLAFQDGTPKDETVKNRQDFCQQIGLSKNNFYWLNQCHSSEIHTIRPKDLTLNREFFPPSGDGLITEIPNICKSIFTADCVPILFYDPKNHIAAAVHAGWRGTIQGIALKTIIQLTRDFGSQAGDIRGYIGASASPCCYQVGLELVQTFNEKFHDSKKVVLFKKGHGYIDLKEANKVILLRAGLKEEHVETSAHCTICSRLELPSFRREADQAGRLTSFIMLK